MPALIIDGTVYVPIQSAVDSDESDFIPWLAEEDLLASDE